MAFSDYASLMPPFVAVTASASTQGFSGLQEGLNFGTVDSVNSNGWRVQVGSSVLFKRSDAQKIQKGSTVYYIVDERTLFFIENATD